MAKLKFYSVIGLFSILCFSTKSAYTQGLYDFENNFFGGICVGANFSQVDGDNFAGYHKVSPNASAIVYFKMDEESLAGSVELMYSQKGCRATDKQVPTLFNGGSGVLKSYSSTLNYVEVPVMLNYVDSKRNIFSGGFSYARLIRAYEFVNGVNNESAYPFKKNDVNLALAAHFRTYKKLYTEIRFSYSLLNIKSATDPRLIKRDLQSNNVYTIRCMYLF